MILPRKKPGMDAAPGTTSRWIRLEFEDEDEGRGRNAKLFATCRATPRSARVQRGSARVGTGLQLAPASLLLRGMRTAERFVLVLVLVPRPRTGSLEPERQARTAFVPGLAFQSHEKDALTPGLSSVSH